MPKIIVTADLHLKNWTDRKTDDKGVPLRTMEILNVFESMCEYASENDISQIVVAGDINDTKSVVI